MGYRSEGYGFGHQRELRGQPGQQVLAGKRQVPAGTPRESVTSGTSCSGNCLCSIHVICIDLDTGGSTLAHLCVRSFKRASMDLLSDGFRIMQRAMDPKHRTRGTFHPPPFLAARKARLS
jgi:hypothetical protein